MRRTGYQRGFVAGELVAVKFIARQLAVEASPVNPRAMVESLGPVISVAGIVAHAIGGEMIPADDYDEWSEEELRDERLRIIGALDTAQYFGTMHRGDDTEERSAERAFERIPEGLRAGIRRYLDEHIPAGDFLMAVFEGDLFGSFSRADIKSRAGMWELISYLYNYAPAPAWGSKRKVEFWLTPAIPRMETARVSTEQLQLDAEMHTACPRCGGRHRVHQVKADPGHVVLPEDGRIKQSHMVQYVWCQGVHLEVVGIDKLEVER